MTGNMYWISALIFSLVLVVIYIDEKTSVRNRKSSDRAFAVMLVYGIFFCLQDMFWGLCANNIIKGEKMLFAASSVFHLAIVLTSYYCLKFFLSYLGDYLKHRLRYIYVCLLAIVLQIVLVTVNLFHPILFRIENGMYVTKVLRSASFMHQYIIYIMAGVVVFMCLKRADQKHREKFKSLFWVAMAPLLTGIFQLYYPEAPFYSLGYFMECFMIHFFIISKDRNELSRSVVLSAISDTYYTMHLFDLKNGTNESLIESDIVGSFIKNRSDGQDSIARVMVASVTDEYRDVMLEFVDFSTVPERMKDSNLITMDFVGKYNGWTRASFIAVERDADGKLTSVMFTTQIIDEQKKKEQEMFANSNTDQLTGVYNRRAYEQDVHQVLENDKNVVYISADVNGLKVVNDTYGHAAGDELLLGAVRCMRQCFGPYGNIYRTGGDEFVMILFATEEELAHIQEDFDNTLLEWKGEQIDNVSVSCGYVTRKEAGDMSIADIAKLADDRMYATKAEFYEKKGVDRRGQNEAHKVLCSLYTKILKINITDDTFAVINMDVDERVAEKGYSESISQWLTGFAKSGYVHPDDVDEYIAKTDIAYMKEYFTQNKTSLMIQYRRKYEDGFKRVMMEIIPASDYATDNQSLFLYVKNIDI